MNARLQALGGNRAGVDRAHPHPVLKAAVSEHLGQVHEARIDRAADGKLGRPGAPADADDVHDRPLRLHEVRPGRAGAAHAAEELEREAILPVGLRKLQEVAALGGTGIVDQRVEAGEARQRKVDQLLRRLGQAQVERQGRALRATGRSHLSQRISRARGDHEAHALAGEAQRDRLADAPAGAGDDAHLALQSTFHRRLQKALRHKRTGRKPQIRLASCASCG